jgi:hypothetical protein
MEDKLLYKALAFPYNSLFSAKIQERSGRKNLLFCEQKRSKKNFISLLGPGRWQTRPKGRKVFLLLFFQKKKFLLFFPAPPAIIAA